MLVLRLWREPGNGSPPLDVTARDVSTTLGEANFLAGAMTANVRLTRDGEVIFEKLQPDRSEAILALALAYSKELSC